MRETQYDTIRELHWANQWVCANAYRSHYVPYFWKRQAEMEKKGGVLFDSRPCKHGTKRGLDYQMCVKIPVVGTIKEGKVNYRPEFLAAKVAEGQKLI